MNRTRSRSLRLALVAGALMSAVSVGTAAADSVYHSERLELRPVGGASGSGMVVNIHPNGPRIYAQERYSLTGAAPDTSYTVWLVLDASALACDFEDLSVLMKADLRTNVAGNATSPADFAFHPEDIPACLRGNSAPGHWEVTTVCGCTLAYLTDWTIVTLD
jgi:hypothetical protein